MPREDEADRDNLEQLYKYFLPRRLIYLSDVARYLGCHRNTAAKRYNVPKEGITLETLARRLCR